LNNRSVDWLVSSTVKFLEGNLSDSENKGIGKHIVNVGALGNLEMTRMERSAVGHEFKTILTLRHFEFLIQVLMWTQLDYNRYGC